MRSMFLSGALFNWVIAAILWLVPIEFFQLFSISLELRALVFVHFFASLVFMFGIAYFWISRNPVAHRDLIVLGAYGKSLLVGVGVVDVLLGVVNWKILLPLSIDLLYAILFFYVLGTWQSGSQGVKLSDKA